MRCYFYEIARVSFSLRPSITGCLQESLLRKRMPKQNRGKVVVDIFLFLFLFIHEGHQIAAGKLPGKGRGQPRKLPRVESSTEREGDNPSTPQRGENFREETTNVGTCEIKKRIR